MNEIYQLYVQISIPICEHRSNQFNYMIQNCELLQNYQILSEINDPFFALIFLN